jgi:2',3'-cyclic-nucleotide 2'-phosphodiesterase/3'-nucleotidase
MRTMGYAAMAIGNHDFDYGQKTLGRFARDAGFPLLAANVRKTGDASPAFGTHVLTEVCGVTVGLLGLVTPTTATWERPENVAGLRFDDPIETAKRYVPALRAAGADVVIVVMHAGPDRRPLLPAGQRSDEHPEAWNRDVDDPSLWTAPDDDRAENEAARLPVEVAGVDAVMSGHTHQTIPEMRIRDAVLVQPNCWGSHVGKVTIALERSGEGWSTQARSATVLSAASAPEATAIVEATRDAHATTRAWLDRPLTTSKVALPAGPSARLVDGGLTDLVNRVQMDAAAEAGFPVDASATAVFGPPRGLPEGAITLRDVYGVYPYESALVIVELSGADVREALEHDARYFRTLDGAHLPVRADELKSDPEGPDFNWDRWAGLDVTLDLSRPSGARVATLRRHGRDVASDDRLRVALNGYRAGGGGGYASLARGRVVWTAPLELRDLVAAWLARQGTLVPEAFAACDFALRPDLSSLVGAAGACASR